MIAIVDDIGPLHDRRKECFVKCIYYADDIREELGRRLGYTLEELQYFELKELLPLKEGRKLDSDELKRRKEFIVLDVDGKAGKHAVYSGKDAEKKLGDEFKESYEQVHQLEGMCASVGKAIGKVKIVYGAKDFPKMNKGDILVTGMTRPEMMPIMKKAAAIVTDEGGLTSHAAVVSREFKIPCVVGTRIASKVFKDGDEVEVNADDGTVRRL